MIDAAKERPAKSAGADTAATQERLRQLEACAAEMKSFDPALQSIKFDKSYVLISKDKNHSLYLQFHECAHTVGDIVVFCPDKKAVSTGDTAAAFMGDGYPKDWPAALYSVMKLGFENALPGHGPVQTDRKPMTTVRN